MQEIFLQLAILIGLSVLMAIIMKKLKQPLIVGYILAGIIAGPVVLGWVHHSEFLELFGSLGVTLLLFIVGLGLNPKLIKDVGKTAFIVGIGQILFTSILGTLIAFGLGFALIPALYLAIAFTFSSTIIILRLIYEKGDQEKLYGRIAIGFLLVQDLVAMFIFIFLSSSANFVNQSIFSALGIIIAKLALIFAIIYILIKFIIPNIDYILAENKEVLFLFSIALAFILSICFQYLGFSLELGALMAGVMLSTSDYHREIASRIQPLRDFFLVMFFIVLGAEMTIAGIIDHSLSIIVFSLFILIGNPLIVLLLMTKLGYTRKTSFFCGLTVAQISEFSLIMLGIGMNLGHLPNSIAPLATSVGLITITFSSYMVMYNQQLFNRILPVLEFLTPYAKKRNTKGKQKQESFQVLLFGAHRLGGGIIELLKKESVSFCAVDHDPNLIKQLQEENINIIYGSADDTGFLDDLDYRKTKLIISTIPDLETNLFLLNYFKKNAPKIKIIPVANQFEEVDTLYTEGALYVVMPQYLGRRFIVDLLKKNLLNTRKYIKERKKHLSDLNYLLSKL